MTKRIVLFVITLAVVALVALRIVQASVEVEAAPDVEEIRAERGIPVEVQPVTRSDLEVRRSFTGTLRGIREATLRARTGDEIVAIPVRVGQRVRSGQVLIRQSSEGSMASVRQAEAAYEQAKRTVERLRPLKEKGAISDQDWDGALTGLRVAEANLAAARKAVVLTSPLGGTVTDILVTPGTFPRIGNPLMRISDLSRLRVLLRVSPEQAAELAAGQRALLDRYGLEGEVARVALQADPESRLVEVELHFSGFSGPGAAGEGDPETLSPPVPGSLVEVEVIVGRREGVLVVPLPAVRPAEGAGGGAAVTLRPGAEAVAWVVDEEGRAHRRAVRVGLVSAGGVEILSGLDDGERVVVSGASLLAEGVKTRIVGG